MRIYFLILGFLTLFVIPVRPFVLAWTWIRSRRFFRPLDAFHGSLVQLEASAEKKAAPDPPGKEPESR